MTQQKGFPSETCQMVPVQNFPQPGYDPFDLNPQTVQIDQNGPNIEPLQSPPPHIINPLIVQQIPVYIPPPQQFIQQNPCYFPDLNIPNQLQFESVLIVEKNLLEQKLESKFFIPSVGEVSWQHYQKCVFCVRTSSGGGSCCSCLKCMDLQFGSYHPLVYETLPSRSTLLIQSEQTSQIFYKGYQIGFIETSYPTLNSITAGRLCTSFPQLRVRGIALNGPKFIVLPNNSCLPTGKFNINPLSCLFASCLGWTQLEREIFVFKETQSGNQKISTFKNRRTRSQACFDTSSAPFRFCYDSRDWPHYQINFPKEVSQYERLLIMATLIHFCMMEQHFALRAY